MHPIGSVINFNAGSSVQTQIQDVVFSQFQFRTSWRVKNEGKAVQSGEVFSFGSVIEIAVVRCFGLDALAQLTQVVFNTVTTNLKFLLSVLLKHVNNLN